MIDWASIKPLIRSQVARLAEITESNVRWTDETGSGPLAGAVPIVWMRVTALVGIGADEERFTPNGTDEQTVTVVGQRAFTLSLRCESFTPDVTDSRNAMSILERVKTRMWRTSFADERAGIFGVADCLAARWLAFTEANLVRPTYLCEFKCLTVDNDVDNTVDAGAWIGEVLSTGTVKEVDGTVVASPSIDVDARNT